MTSKLGDQIEGSFVQGIGFFLTEEHEVDSNGELITNGTWTYKPPAIDNIPRKLTVEMMNSVAHQNRILSSKGFFFLSVTAQKYGLSCLL